MGIPMGHYLIPRTWHSGQPGWIANYRPQTVSVDTEQDASLARTSGWIVRASSSDGGSIAYDFKWPSIPLYVGNQSVAAIVPVVTFFTWVRARPGQTFTGTLALWDLTQNKNDSVPFEVADAWQPLSLSAEQLGTDDDYRIELYLSSPSIEVLVDRLVVT